MTEGHQQLPVLLSLPLCDLLMWGTALQAVVNAKNDITKAAAEKG